ncbi:LytR/AlgR family response regulator transcription factor [Marinicella meishanensis]|uniref:LytR/AlgR family response regulator transcription factor n=1 Tax=Marinicella meishanensis TaxID=2873263 RepID=UPI001CBC4D61|nr:LytTR family DNA-binding domain-containing protein [Marinicella sp. NBU2979]
MMTQSLFKSLFRLDLKRTYSNYYLFNSRIVTHVAFWLAYYISFSLIWSGRYGLYGSFYLEFILLPMRMAATYLVIYWAMPRFLLTAKLLAFLLSLAGILLICGLFQRLSIYFFYEEFLAISQTALFNPQAIFRSMLLINTTVMLAMTIKFYGLYQELKQQGVAEPVSLIELKSDRRMHLIHPDDISHIQGLGNYVTIHLLDGSELTSYTTLKNLMQQLPEQFLRVHKSHIINKQHLKSYNNEDLQIGNKTIPRGKDIEDADLKLQ